MEGNSTQTLLTFWNAVEGEHEIFVGKVKPRIIKFLEDFHLAFFGYAQQIVHQRRVDRRVDHREHPGDFIQQFLCCLLERLHAFSAKYVCSSVAPTAES